MPLDWEPDMASTMASVSSFHDQTAAFCPAWCPSLLCFHGKGQCAELPTIGLALNTKRICPFSPTTAFSTALEIYPHGMKPWAAVPPWGRGLGLMPSGQSRVVVMQ